ncbi:MAG: hypothetical protein H8D23_16590 [Candidatus Brocadiales bacterium]|nr:hypothetical protein [Candidatus Brocadiales bacterium]
MGENDLEFNDNAFALMDDERAETIVMPGGAPSKPLPQLIDQLNQPAEDDKKKGGSESEALLQTVAKQGEQIETLVSTLSQNLQNTNQPPPKDDKPAPKTLKEALGLPDDFVYDEAEAADDPESDSGRYLNARIAIQAKRMALQDEEKRQQLEGEKQYNEQKKALMEKYKLDEAGYAKFEKQMEAREFTLEDMFLTINRQQYAENVSRSTARQFTQQRDRVSTHIPSLAGGAGAPKQPLSEAQLFNQYFGVDDKTFETTA